jgi:hypothetical protein
MSAVMRRSRVIGAVAAVLTLLAGMLSAPAADAASGPRATVSEETFCSFTPPKVPGDTLWVYPVYDPENGDIGGLSANWVGNFDCTPVSTGHAIQEVEFDSTLWYDDLIEVDQAFTDCDLEAGDPTCDDVSVSKLYICDTGPPCAGTYHVSYLAHIVMRPGIYWEGTFPTYCDEIHPPPLQVVDCYSESNEVVVPPNNGD